MTARRHAPGTVRAALAYRNFRIFFLAAALSNVGTWMQNFMLPAYIDDRTGSAGYVGLVVFAQLGPLLLLSVPAGVLAGRLDRTRLVLSMQTAMLVGTVTLAVLVSTHAPLWTLFAAQLAIGVANAVNAPSFMASLPAMVDRSDLAGAVALNSVMLNGSRVAGPLLAAGLSTVGFGVDHLFLVNAATYVFMIVPLLMIGLPKVVAGSTERGWRTLTRGVQLARQRRVLSRMVLTTMTFSVISLTYIGLFPSVARLNFGIDSTSGTYKLLYVVWGTGAMLGSLAVGSWLAAISKRRLIMTGFVGFGACLAAFALVRSAGLAFPVAFVLGFMYFQVMTSISTVFQQNMTDGERGQLMPLWLMSFGGSVPIGNLIAGPFIDAFGARSVLLVGAGYAVFLAWWSDLRRLPPGQFLSSDQ
jgi:MFS family permease